SLSSKPGSAAVLSLLPARLRKESSRRQHVSRLAATMAAFAGSPANNHQHAGAKRAEPCCRRKLAVDPRPTESGRDRHRAGGKCDQSAPCAAVATNYPGAATALDPGPKRRAGAGTRGGRASALARSTDSFCGQRHAIHAATDQILRVLTWLHTYPSTARS